MFRYLQSIFGTRIAARPQTGRKSLGSRRRRLGAGFESLETRAVLSAFGAYIYTTDWAGGNENNINIMGGGYAESGEVWNDAKVWIDQNGVGIADDEVVAELKTHFIEPLFQMQVTIVQTERFKLYKTAADRFLGYNVDQITFWGRGGDDSFENKTHLDSIADGNHMNHEHADDDWFKGGSGYDSFHGAGGDDVLEGNGSLDLLTGGEGSDHLYGGGGNDIIAGYINGIPGGHAADFIYGGEGNDTLYGSGGNDWIEGGEGRDMIRGYEGTDKLFGDAGNDIIFGGLDADHIEGGSGEDTLLGGTIGFNYMRCFDQFDPQDPSSDFLYGGDDNDLLYGDMGNDVLFGEAGFDVLVGGMGSDGLHGGSDADLLFGGLNEYLLDGVFDVFNEWNDSQADLDEKGDDFLMGGSGLDQLYGMDGNDYLDGGHDGQADTMSGGHGNDQFKLYWVPVIIRGMLHKSYELENILDFNWYGTDIIV